MHVCIKRDIPNADSPHWSDSFLRDIFNTSYERTYFSAGNKHHVWWRHFTGLTPVVMTHPPYMGSMTAWHHKKHLLRRLMLFTCENPAELVWLQQFPHCQGGELCVLVSLARSLRKFSLGLQSDRSNLLPDLSHLPHIKWSRMNHKSIQGAGKGSVPMATRL